MALNKQFEERIAKVNDDSRVSVACDRKQLLLSIMAMTVLAGLI
ncbi:hypothetical protein [Amphibacillus marinus]|nr:hypothetical protein [Amphibacillus marinus]